MSQHEVGGTVLLDAHRIPVHSDTGSVHTTCAYCGVGCGVVATVEDAAVRQVRIDGDSAHPANLGRLCSKGSALGETLSLEGRLLHPEVRGERVSWDVAADTIAREIRRVQARYGRDAVAFYVSGQLLTEDYYVANKLMKGFLGTANIDTNSRLCMSSSVAGHKRAFGSDTVPNSYEDFELADLIVLTGSNTAWCHPVLFQRIKAEKQRRPNLRIVNIDPRATATNEIADLHLPLKPGSDVWLFNGLLAHLAAQGVIDHDYLAQHTTGFGVALAEAKASAGKLSQVADATGLDDDAIAQFYRWFASTPRSLTLYSQGVNQSSAGTDKVNSLLNCHLATGRIGKPGSGPFSLTGQPNAMGGREVGGLANQLAAHLELTDPAHLDLVQRFWQAPQMARGNGLKAVDLFEAVHSGNIKLIWIMGTNPVVSLPDADRVKAALAGAECVIVSDCIADTDTNRLAHIKLPARGWGEKDGTVTNSERRISRQRGFLPAPGEAMPDWWIITRVAQALGHEAAFPYRAASEVFAEHAALSGFENAPEGILRDFDISALAGLDAECYDALTPVQWPVSTGRPHGQPRLFADGGFFTPDRKARLLPVKPRAPHHPTCADYPFVLNTGRIRDQWHTMTRTGLTPRLLAHLSEPFVEMHPRDAAAQGLRDGELARLSTRWGQMLARVQTNSGQHARTVFVPMHWTGALSSQGRVGPLVNPVVDPVSGQPENKHTPVSVVPWQPAWQGFWLHRDAVELPATDYAVAIRGDNGWRHELAGAQATDLQALADAWLPLNDGEWLEYADLARGLYRRALIRDGRLVAALVLATNSADVPERAWLSGQLGQVIDESTRRGLLSGRPSDPASDVGRTVCACFGVGEKTIRRAIAAERLESVAAIGRCLKAGTNCGSCQSELKTILATCGVKS